VGSGDHGAVVVADDDPALRLLCRINLELEGYRVLEAASAADVERLLASEDVGVVLLDVHLGDDDGIEVARRLRADRPDIGIAFFTGSAPQLASADRAIADGVIPKPFSLEELIGEVRRLARV
jgi:DNA-binding response OmpR family regulator